MGPIHSASREARYSLTVTTWTPSPGNAFRYAASVDISVLPSPVRISAMRPSFSVRPPMSRSEEHTSELQSRRDLVCRLLLEKKKKNESDALYKSANKV